MVVGRNVYAFIFAISLCAFTCHYAVVNGQGPQPYSPPSSGPSAPRPIVQRPQSRIPNAPRTGYAPRTGRTVPQHGVQPGNSNYSPHRSDHSPLTRGVPNRNNFSSRPPNSGTGRFTGPVFTNPLAVRAPTQQFDPAKASRQLKLPVGLQSPGWIKANQFAVQKNLSQLQQTISSNLKSDPSLSGLMNAVTALDYVSANKNLTQSYRIQAKHLAYQQIQSDVARPLPWVATAKFALEDQNKSLLRSTTQALLNKFPENPHGHYFAGVQALDEGDWKTAENALRQARSLGLPDESVASLLKIAIDNQVWIWQYAQIIFAIIVIWFLGLLGLYILGSLLSKQTLKVAQRDDPFAKTASDHLLRSVYRFVVNAAGIYYYISLPIILIVSVALPLALCYATLMLPYLNFWLLGIVAIGSIAGILSAISGIRTSLVHIPDRPYGRLLTEEESPDFWKLVREVANQLNTRPVDEIWITPETDMSVLEHGNWYARLQNRSKRVLILGAGLLPGFKVDAMRAVLAHEYAHFQNRDTAGGHIALRVQIAMYRLADTIGKRGKVRAWDITVWYLRFFHGIFQRLSLGASRLQEVLADRTAVEAYGGSAIICGLKHVIRRELEFNFLFSQAVGKAIRKEKGSVAFFAPQKTIKPFENRQIDIQFRSYLQTPTSEADSHPGPKDRFESARRSLINIPVGRETLPNLFGDAIQQVKSQMDQMLTGLVEFQVRQTLTNDTQALHYVNSILKNEVVIQYLEARAAIHFRSGRFELALKDINTILEHVNNYASALISRTHIYEALEDYTSMAKDLLKLQAMSNEFPVGVQYDIAIRLGSLFVRFKKFKKAAYAYDAALRLEPKSTVAVIGRIEAAIGMGDTDDPDIKKLAYQASLHSPEDDALPAILKAVGMNEEFAANHWTKKSKRPNIGELSERITSESNSSFLAWGTVALVASVLLLIGTMLFFDNASENGYVLANSDYQNLTEVLDLEIKSMPKPTAAKEVNAIQITENLSETVDENPVSEELDPATPGTDLNDSQKEESSRNNPEKPQNDRRFGEIDETQSASLSDSHRNNVIRRNPRGAHQSSSSSIVTENKVNESLENTQPAPKIEVSIEIQLQQIGKAFLLRKSKNLDLLPAPALKTNDTGTRLSWRVHLLPQLGLEDLYSAFQINEPWDSEHNLKLVDKIPEIYQTKSSEGHTRFRIFRGKQLFVQYEESANPKAALDSGMAPALVFYVGADREEIWTKPDLAPLSLRQPHKSLGIGYSDPTHILLADGYVLNLDKGIHPKKLLALLTARGGEVVDQKTWFANSRQAKVAPPKEPSSNNRSSKDKPTPEELLVEIPSVRTPKMSQSNIKIEEYNADPVKKKMSTISFALMHYEDRYNTFPVPRSLNNLDAYGRPLLSWRVHLLPFIDEQPLYSKFMLDEPWDSPRNRKLLKYLPEIYQTENDSASLTRFRVLSGEQLPYDENRSPTYRSVTDGVANTILFVRTARNKATSWTKPDDLLLDLDKPLRSLGRLKNSLYCAMMDGNIIQLPRNTTNKLLTAMATHQGDEIIDGGTINRFTYHSAGIPLTTIDGMSDHAALKLRKLILGMLNYQDTYRFFPSNLLYKDQSEEYVPQLSWRVALLPYLGQNNLYEQFRKDEPWDSPHNKKLIQYMPDIYRDADDSIRQTETRFITLSGPDTPFPELKDGKKPRLISSRRITDGSSKTILIVQAAPKNAVPWTKPVDLPFDSSQPLKSLGDISARHGLPVAMADGSIKVLKPSITVEQLKGLATPNGGEVIRAIK